MSIANRRALTSIASPARGLVLLFVMASCSVVPDWSVQEFREIEITVHYAGSDEHRTVPLPSSTKHLLILELEVGPGELRETYRQSTRLLLLPAGDSPLRLDCRYRLFRRHAADGSPLPWPEPSDLFPGAARIVHHD